VMYHATDPMYAELIAWILTCLGFFVAVGIVRAAARIGR
jgi:hypothetical protein